MPDRTTRAAALWATAAAVPVAVLVGLLLIVHVVRGAAPAAAPSRPAPVPAAVPSGPVAMPAPRLAAHPAAVCRAVTARLPAALRTLPARRVSAGAEQNAAYGEPPVTVACGVPQPRLCDPAHPQPGCVPLHTELLGMDDVCWYAEPGPAAAAFTTMDRAVPVRVSVPNAYAGAAQWANEFSGTLAQADPPATAGVPAGCR
jgi:Protein of unknown function (DUF3515)